MDDVGLCFVGIANKRNRDPELLPELIVTEINVAQKKIDDVVICQSPNQIVEIMKNHF